MTDLAYDVVFLDAGGVLVTPDPQRILQQLRSGGFDVDVARLIEAHYEGMVANDAAQAVAETFGAYHAAYAGHLGLHGDEQREAVALLDTLFRAGMLWTEPLPGVVDGLRALAATGVTLVVVSNADGTVAELLAAAGLLQVGAGPGVEVAAIIDSGAVGVAKPDPRIFEIALDAVGATADRALHVGDSLHFDVAGARLAGIEVVLVDPFDARPDADCTRVRSLADVVALLDA